MEKLSAGFELLEEGVNLLAEKRALEAHAVFREVERMEHESNDARKNISDSLSTGALASDERSDYLVLVGKIDGIADRLNFVAAYLGVPHGFAKGTLADFVRGILAAKKSTGLLQSSLEALPRRDPRIMEICYEIEVLERKADSIKLETYKKCLKNSKTRQNAHLVYLIAYKLEEITDLCEYCTDLVRSLYLKSV